MSDTEAASNDGPSLAGVPAEEAPHEPYPKPPTEPSAEPPQEALTGLHPIPIDEPLPEPSQEALTEPDPTPTDQPPPRRLSEELSQASSLLETSPESSREVSPALPPGVAASADQLRSRSGRVVKRKVWTDSLEGSPPASPRDPSKRPPAKRRAPQPVQAPSRKLSHSADELLMAAVDIRSSDLGDSTQFDMGVGVDDDGARIPVRDQNGKFIGSRPPTADERKDAGVGQEGNSSRGGIFKTAAISVLRQEMRLMPTGEIARNALRRGLIHVQGKTPEATMAAAMYTDVKRKQKRSVFIRPHEGLFGLREWIENGIAYGDPAEDAHAEDESLIRGLRGNPLHRPRHREPVVEREPEVLETEAFPMPAVPAELPEISIGLPQRLLAPGGALSPKALEKSTGVQITRLRDPSPGSPAPLRPRSARRAAMVPGWRRSESQDVDEEEPVHNRSRPARKRPRTEEGSPDMGLQLLLDAIDGEGDPLSVKDEPFSDAESDEAEVSSLDSESPEVEEPLIRSPWLGNKHKARRTARASPHAREPVRITAWHRSRSFLGIGNNPSTAKPAKLPSPKAVRPPSRTPEAEPATPPAVPPAAAPPSHTAGPPGNILASLLLGPPIRFPTGAPAVPPPSCGPVNWQALTMLATQFPDLFNGTGPPLAASLAAYIAGLGMPQPALQRPPAPAVPQHSNQGNVDRVAPAFPSGLAAGNGYLIRPQAMLPDRSSRPPAQAPRGANAPQDQRMSSGNPFPAAWGRPKEASGQPSAKLAEPHKRADEPQKRAVKDERGFSPHTRRGESPGANVRGFLPPSGQARGSQDHAGNEQAQIFTSGKGKPAADMLHQMASLAAVLSSPEPQKGGAHLPRPQARPQEGAATASQQIAQLLALTIPGAATGNPEASVLARAPAPVASQGRPQAPSPAAMLLQQLTRDRAGADERAWKPQEAAGRSPLPSQQAATSASAAAPLGINISFAGSNRHDPQQTQQYSSGLPRTQSGAMAAQVGKGNALSTDEAVKAYVLGRREAVDGSHGAAAAAEAKLKELSDWRANLEQVFGSKHPEVGKLDLQMSKLYQAAGKEALSKEALQRSYICFYACQPEDARDGPVNSVAVKGGLQDKTALEQALLELGKGLGKGGLPTFGQGGSVSVAARTAP